MGVDISPFYVMEALREAEKLANAGHDIVHLSVGQPSAMLPDAVISEAQRSLREKNQGYTDSLGMITLREAIGDFYKTRYGISVPVSNIAVTVGSSIGCALALMTAFDAGQKIGITVPYYPAYPNMMRALNFQPEMLRADIQSRYQTTPQILESCKAELAGLMIASPSNPAGTVIPPDDMHQLVMQCKSRNIQLVSDEIYHGITYDKVKADTALRYSEDAIVVNSFSKYFLMPGFRLGWVVMPERFVRHFANLLQNFVISAPSLSQHVALHMLQHTEILDKEVARYKENRAILLGVTERMGMKDIAPADGAFYLYADVSALCDDSKSFCQRMLHEANVSIVPGYDFDTQRGHRMIRISYCGSKERIEEAASRLLSWYQKQ